MRSKWVIGAALVVLLTACKPISGGACSPIGSTQTDDTGQIWTCAKNETTGNGYWYKGKP
ncbi:MAG TPA: hypothetical protein VK878_23285 [Candidatus Deferrimicrobiaceae bacterium]|nr:hypothetical protein [Candidatus Deferrimicrobiaceae bacterium]